jgi:hypothetical protein
MIHLEELPDIGNHPGFQKEVALTDPVINTPDVGTDQGNQDRILLPGPERKSENKVRSLQNLNT